MTDDKIPRLSRRRVLGTLGALGAGAALGGAGTSAFFSDYETYEDNILAAGSLDLKVDWEEHYHLTNEQVNIGDNGQFVPGVLMEDPDDDNYVGFPDPQDPMVWVHVDAIDDYMDLTSIEAYPDDDNDGIQDPLELYDACEDFADTPDDLHPEEGKALRTFNDDTAIAVGDGVYEPKPILSLEDVKPGDFGELTLSFHVCDNPGYVWLQGGNLTDKENSLTEPELKDSDDNNNITSGDWSEDQLADAQINNSELLSVFDPDDQGELAENIRTMLWYDEDGDNVFEPGGVSGEVDIALVIDESGSMLGTKMEQAKQGAKALVSALTLGPARVSVIGFSSQTSNSSGTDDARLRQGLTDDPDALDDAIDALTANAQGGFTNMESGVLAGHEELLDTDVSNDIQASENDRDGAAKIMVFLGDGFANIDEDNDGSVSPIDEATAAKEAGIEMYTIGYGLDPADPNDATAIQTLEDMASEPEDEYFYLAATAEIEQVFAQISQIIVGEEAFFRGTLAELVAEVEDGHGIPLDGNRATAFDELGGDPTAPEREAFVNSTTNAIGMAWWLPLDHANEVQTDSVSFDLGFYTEQARHNTGAGMPIETPNGQNNGAQ